MSYLDTDKLLEKAKEMSSYPDTWQEDVNLVSVSLIERWVEELSQEPPQPIKKAPIPSPKSEIHSRITEELNAIYIAKNTDYGDAFGETYRKLGIISAVTRITDKVNRLQSLATKSDEERLVKDESIVDTLKDLSNYALMTLIEMGYEPEVDLYSYVDMSTTKDIGIGLNDTLTAFANIGIE